MLFYKRCLSYSVFHIAAIRKQRKKDGWDLFFVSRLGELTIYRLTPISSGIWEASLRVTIRQVFFLKKKKQLKIQWQNVLAFFPLKVQGEGSETVGRRYCFLLNVK